MAGAKWSDAEEAKLRRYAERGISMSEAATLLGRSEASVAIKAGNAGIHFHGPPGAPPGNQNGAVSWYGPGHYPTRWLPSDDAKRLPLCRACGQRVVDPAVHYREVHSRIRKGE